MLGAFVSPASCHESTAGHKPPGCVITRLGRTICLDAPARAGQRFDGIAKGLLMSERACKNSTPKGFSDEE